MYVYIYELNIFLLRIEPSLQVTKINASRNKLEMSEFSIFSFENNQKAS